MGNFFSQINTALLKRDQIPLAVYNSSPKQDLNSVISYVYTGSFGSSASSSQAQASASSSQAQAQAIASSSQAQAQAIASSSQAQAQAIASSSQAQAQAIASSSHAQNFLPGYSAGSTGLASILFGTQPAGSVISQAQSSLTYISYQNTQISQGGSQGISQGGSQGISQGGSQGISQGGSQGISQGGLNFKKKGFVVGNSDPVGGLKVNNLNTGWYYTWGPSQSMLPVPSGIKFTPMIWSLTDTFTITEITSLLGKIKNLPYSNTDNILLTYNEPDGAEPTAQANMTVGIALKYWPTVLSTMVSTYTTPPLLGSPVMYGSTTNLPSSAAGTGKNINSMPQPTISGQRTINISNNPSVINNVTLNPAIWLDNFLLQLYDTHKVTPYTRSPFPDFICIHWYGVPQVKSFTDYIANVYAKYNLPIWVTEYSCADWYATCCPTAHPSEPTIDWSYPTTATISQSTNTTAQFMTQTMQWMNQQSFVQRYTWKERPLLVPPNANITYSGSVATSINVGGTSYPLDSSMSTMAANNPDVMGQSTLFNSYQHFPTALPPLTPLGNLYASL